MGWPSRSKYSKHLFMMKSSTVAVHLPETVPLSRPHFRRMLARHGSVIVKPSNGSGGKGVLFVSRRGRACLIQSGRSRRVLRTVDHGYAFVARQSRHQIIQKAIPLASVNRRLFDLRVMVQRKRGGNWVVTGKLAKVAGQGYKITNVRRSSGHVVPLGTVISRSPHLQTAALRSYEKRINLLAVRAANRLGVHYPGLRIVGFDMAFDQSGRIWIIEANFSPAVSLFLKLKNRAMYRTVMAYKKP
ncbi:YheC/YheD family protein [Marinicrinis sediminis]|uniref:YheC/YheD family protein n=1 Tax=Marinicrinis sediminis TaxID=1652465 RepID=A0ABW5R8U0_9BACL